MSDLEKTNSPVSARTARTWDFMETTLISLLAYGAFTLAALLVLFFLVTAYDGASIFSPAAQLNALAEQGRWQGIALTLASPVAIAVLWVAIRMAGRGFSEYLALNWPSAGELVRALAITSMILMVQGFVTVNFSDGAGDASLNPYLDVRGYGGLLVLLIGGSIVAPMMEEFIVRGFMFRGWSQSFVGPTGTIVLTSVVWALNHTQYHWYDRFWIFVFGLALGHFRWRTNSTWLTVMVHSASNVCSFFFMGPYR
ncbi:CPBP family intramembrane glutamic endopeptidase [Bradyrhizobium cenepequi]|uniref:CPBP family intramembrane glutamic endopeptidase n=1 Tax=Bradyrhizobium cenepequi TaxID=2821403 RepID=UPI001CE38DBB|nr:type II CAAX endopeptidase family protein [Bradyrhizobium cenepequi]MCA6109723.1 CPBP family intramembrane metalloprotease [Bradyrhizobium cenepequi]